MRCLSTRLCSARSGGIFHRLRSRATYACDALRDLYERTGRYDNAPPESKLPKATPPHHRRIRENPLACPRSVLHVPVESVLRCTAVSGGDAERHVLPLTRRGRRSYFSRSTAADVILIDLHGSSSCSIGRDAACDAVRRFLETGSRCVVRVRSPELDAINGFGDLEFIAELGDAVEGIAISPVSTKTYYTVEPYIHPAHHLWAIFDTPLAVAHAAEICAQRHFQCAIVFAPDVVQRMGIIKTDEEALKPTRNINTMAEKGTGEADKSTRESCSSPNNDNNTNNDDDHNQRSNGEHYTTKNEQNECKDDNEERLMQLLPLLHSSYSVILAARAHEMFVIDGPLANATDVDGFIRDVRRSRRLGFDGRVLSHASQIAACHAAFAPTEKEMRWAQNVPPEAERSLRQMADRLLERQREMEEEAAEQESKAAERQRREHRKRMENGGKGKDQEEEKDIA